MGSPPVGVCALGSERIVADEQTRHTYRRISPYAGLEGQAAGRLAHEKPAAKTAGGTVCDRCQRLSAKSLRFRVRNLTRGTTIGDAIDSAESSAERRTGLLKHHKLEEGAGLWIVPCEAVHTFFMKFAIDLIYLDRKRRVRGVRRAVAPWRLSICLPAHSVLELPTGTIDRTNTQEGDELELVRC